MSRILRGLLVILALIGIVLLASSLPAFLRGPMTGEALVRFLLGLLVIVFGMAVQRIQQSQAG